MGGNGLVAFKTVGKVFSFFTSIPLLFLLLGFVEARCSGQTPPPPLREDLGLTFDLCGSSVNNNPTPQPPDGWRRSSGEAERLTAGEKVWRSEKRSERRQTSRAEVGARAHYIRTSRAGSGGPGSTAVLSPPEHKYHRTMIKL